MAPLNRVPPPHPERAICIREWLIDQIAHDDPPAALLNISITTRGRIRTTGLAIEPEHAQVMLDELDNLRAKLLGLVGVRQCPTASVITLPRRRTA